MQLLNSKKSFKKSYFYKHIISAILHPRNFLFCVRYPFWKSYNAWTAEFLGYSFTEYQFIPVGWRKAFGRQLSKDFKAILIKNKLLSTFRFLDIKEKYGILTMYCNISDNVEIESAVSKYELLSMCYCINCGKQVRYKTKGFMSYICKDCAKLYENVNRLSIKDIPHISKYITDDTGHYTEIELDLEVEYGIDFKESWGLY